MLRNLYEIEKQNQNKYDGLRDYCLCEKVNEEYARNIIEKEWAKNRCNVYLAKADYEEQGFKNEETSQQCRNFKLFYALIKTSRQEKK